MPSILDLAQQLEDMPLASALAESRYAFPIVEGVHLIGLCLSVGLIAVIDLRVIGVFLRPVPVETVLRALRPWALGGFAVTFASGLALFCAEATATLSSPVFVWKIAFVILAGLNALAFEWRLQRAPAPPRAAPRPELPAALRISGGISLALWALVVATGRLLAYLPH
jgi:hypothetical protein